MTRIDLVQKEAKTLKFVITEKSTGIAIDVSSATLTFYFKETELADPEYTKNDGDFNKLLASSGIVKLPLDTDELDYSGKYFGLLKVAFSGTHIDKYYFQIRLTTSPE